MQLFNYNLGWVDNCIRICQLASLISISRFKHDGEIVGDDKQKKLILNFIAILYATNSW